MTARQGHLVSVKNYFFTKLISEPTRPAPLRAETHGGSAANFGMVNGDMTTGWF